MTSSLNLKDAIGLPVFFLFTSMPFYFLIKKSVELMVRPKKIIGTEESKQKFAVLHEDIDTERAGARAYYFSFIGRRTIYALAIVVLQQAGSV